MVESNLPAWLAGIHHDGSERYISALYPGLSDIVRLRLRVPAGAPIRRVVLRTFPDGEQALSLMRFVGTDGPADWYEGDLTMNEPVVHYRFILEAGDGVWHFAAAGPSAHVPLDQTDFRLLAGFQAPGWLTSAVFYQVFPDRFANGDPANDPQPTEFEYAGRQAQTYPWEAPLPDEQFSPLAFFGGDLQGLIDHLDHIQELGANAIYLNPIFTAHSNHKYDVIDYDRVDPHLGGDEALIRLRKALDARGMRYLLDIVPNHCGYWHPWFQKAREDAAAAEAGFFTFNNHPNDYASWLGVWTLPKLNYLNAELRHRIYAGPDSVFRRWLRPPFSADGWRVDVANMLGRHGETQIGTEIVRDIRTAVKQTAPDSYLMGENFFDATGQLQGDQFDGVMNYGGFTHPLWYWLSGYHVGAWGFPEPIRGPLWSTEALAQAWRSRLAAVPWAIALQQYNLLGSHDVARIRTTVGGNGALHRLATALLMTYPGVPGLYYGDEIGMENQPGVGERGCMIWDRSRWDTAMFDYTKSLIALRRSSHPLQVGGFQLLHALPETVVFQRESTRGRVVVVAHRAEQPLPAGPLSVAHGGIPDGTRFTEHFSGRETVVRAGTIMLPDIPQGAMIWIADA